VVRRCYGFFGTGFPLVAVVEGVTVPAGSLGAVVADVVTVVSVVWVAGVSAGAVALELVVCVAVAVVVSSTCLTGSQARVARTSAPDARIVNRFFMYNLLGIRSGRAGQKT
jgi:hypothetical protein